MDKKNFTTRGRKKEKAGSIQEEMARRSQERPEESRNHEMVRGGKR